MNNADQPAYPVLMQQIGDSEYRAAKPGDPKEWSKPCAGLTKIEVLATNMHDDFLAFPSEERKRLIGSQNENESYPEWVARGRAIWRIIQAKALLAALEEDKNKKS